MQRRKDAKDRYKRLVALMSPSFLCAFATLREPFFRVSPSCHPKSQIEVGLPVRPGTSRACAAAAHPTGPAMPSPPAPVETICVPTFERDF